MQFVSAQVDRGSGCTGGQTLVCNLDFLSAQASTGTAIVTVRPTAAGQFTILLQVSSNGTDWAPQRRAAP